MKKIFFFLTTIIIAMSFTFPELIPIGGDMPKKEAKMTDVSGKEISMQDAAEKNGVLVMFISNSCPFVIKNEKRITEISKFAKKNKIGVILLNSNEAYRTGEDSYDEMKSFYTKNNLNCYYVLDKNSEVADAFDAKRTPECFLFDKSLKLVYHGAIDDNPSDETAVKRQHLKEAITEIESGNAVTVTESRSVGCQIKRKSN
jgi:peroxiredoxin